MSAMRLPNSSRSWTNRVRVSRVLLLIVALAIAGFALVAPPMHAENPPPHVHRVMKALPKEWRYVAATWTNEDATVASLHLGRTKKLADGVVATWRRYDYEPPQGPEGATPAAKILAKVEYRCEDLTERTLDMTVYAASGDVIHASTAPSDWIAVVPESLSESLAEFLCSVNPD